MTENFNELKKRLILFSALCGANCYWKLYTEHLIVPDYEIEWNLSHHEIDFCKEIKKNKRNEQKCVLNDHSEIAKSIIRNHSPFVKNCHAGATEIIIPICPVRGKCTGIVMVGPFRKTGAPPMFDYTCDSFLKLPIFPDEKIDAIMAIGIDFFVPIVKKIFLDNAEILQKQPEDSRIKEAVEFIKINFKRDLKVKDIAKHIFLSQSRLLHLFKDECGISVGDFMMKLKLDEARKALLGSAISIGEIASQAGFSDHSYFSSMFKREYKMTPMLYRTSHSVIFTSNTDR